MPKVHEYVNGSGYYIRSAFKGKIVTYKVTPSGINYLRSYGYQDGSEISLKMLDKMRKKKYIYTGGSGPGELEDWDFDPVATAYPSNSSSLTTIKSQHQAKSNFSDSTIAIASVCSTQTVIIIFILIILIVICAQCS